MLREGTLGDFPILEARFIRRPNRFIIICEIAGHQTEAYLPNPGRMWELLFFGVRLYVKENEKGKKTPFTVLAVERENTWIMLHTHWTNDVAEVLLRNGRISGLEEANVVRREVKVGQHRFDFLLHKAGQPYYLEVKSCTLFEQEVAMFPDAVTERGRRHIKALSQLHDEGMSCGVLVMIHWPDALFFLPDFHTDLAFAQAFCEARHKVDFYPLALHWQKNLSYESVARRITIPWSFLEREVIDKGSYILVMELEQEENILVDGLENQRFRAGYYLYVNDSAENLTKCMDGHLRKRKKVTSPISALRNQAKHCLALPIRTTDLIKHDLALALRKIADWEIPGFGVSDCSCATHLFGMQENPVHQQKFMALLQFFRMTRIVAEFTEKEREKLENKGEHQDNERNN